MNPGKLEKIQFRVAKLRDGRSYITRRVDAWQEDRFIFTASMSFQIPEPKQPQYYAPPPVISARRLQLGFFVPEHALLDLGEWGDVLQ